MGALVSFKLNNFNDAPPPAPLSYSPQQTAAFDWVTNGLGNALMTAVAGSGKTTTLLGMVDRMQGYISIVAFNRAIRYEIEAKIQAKGCGPNVRVGTFHSFGFGAWRRVAPNVKLQGMGEKNAGYYKYDRIFDIMDGVESSPDFAPTPIPYEYRAFVQKLTGLAKQYAVGASPLYPIDDPVQWVQLVEHFDLDQMLAEDRGREDVHT